MVCAFIFEPYAGCRMLSPVTVLEVIQRTTSFLSKKGVDSARLHAELLLAHVLKLPRMQLYLNFERVLTGGEQDTLRQLVLRRGQREPLQHIIGSTSFCGLEMTVNRQVLIPRPETELLAEHGWTFLNQRSKAGLAGSIPGARHAEPEKEQGDQGPWALDFGTGSGCLAIALAVKCPTAQIAALDVAPEALEVARNNATHHGVAERIRFLLGNGLAALPRGLRFDLIIGNPPYIPTTDIEALQPEVRNHDPRSALDGGPDGLNCYRHLAVESGGFLKAEGKLMLEFGDSQENRLAELFQNENWIVEGIIQDYTQRPRLLIARRNI